MSVVPIGRAATAAAAVAPELLPDDIEQQHDDCMWALSPELRPPSIHRCGRLRQMVAVSALSDSNAG